MKYPHSKRPFEKRENFTRKMNCKVRMTRDSLLAFPYFPATTRNRNNWWRIISRKIEFHSAFHFNRVIKISIHATIFSPLKLLHSLTIWWREMKHLWLQCELPCPLDVVIELYTVEISLQFAIPVFFRCPSIVGCWNVMWIHFKIISLHSPWHLQQKNNISWMN